MAFLLILAVEAFTETVNSREVVGSWVMSKTSLNNVSLACYILFSIAKKLS